jgi:hypothetical protein
MNNLLDKLTLIKRPYKVFLCYSHTDHEVICTLYSQLKKDSIEVWLDKEELLPGQHWQHEIRKAILRSDVVIVCLSRAFNKQHGYRHEELNIALEKANLLPVGEIFIIPVRLEKCAMPESLQHLHRVDLFDDDGYEKLIRALRKHVSTN